MGYSAPKTWAVADVLTSSDMNVYVRDNIGYLHGDAGAISVVSDFTATNTVNASGSASGALTATGTANNSLARLSLVAKTAGGVAVDYRFLTNALGGGEWLVFDNHASATRMYMDSSGNVGIGPNTPLGKFHVQGAGAVAGAGFVVGSVAAVTSIQTIFAAGTVARGAAFFILDRNNTGGAVNAVNTANTGIVNGGSPFTYTNNDTISVAITAGGAVTVTRTIGTNGTHDITMIALLT